MIALSPSRCLFCVEAGVRELFPERLFEESFSPYSFSARRNRRREHFRIVECASCGLVRSDPVLGQEGLNTLYAQSTFMFPDEEAYAQRTYERLLDRLLRLRAIGSLLEIGASTGFFLGAAQRMGISDVAGFEPSRACWERAPLEVRSSLINDVYSPSRLGDRTFDAVCGFHVFDHLGDPLETLRSVREKLSGDGLLLIVCHNVESFTARLFGEHSPIYDIEHTYLFSTRTLGMLLEAAGYQIEDIGPVTNWYPLRYWMRMLGSTRPLARLLPERVGKLPLCLRGGNLFAVGRKVAQ